jgi:hypothetical protein
MEGRGRNPVSANIMKVRIKFFFNDIQTLFTPFAVDSGGNSITYSDLIRYPPSLEKSKTKIKGTGASFRIRLILGWSVNPENRYLKESGGQAFIDAAENSKISIMADMYSHEMDFNQDGSLSLDVLAMGALESTFSSAASNIMQNIDVKNVDIAAAKAAISKEEDRLIRTVKGGDKLERLKELENKIQAYKKIRAKISKSIKAGTMYSHVDVATQKKAISSMATSYTEANDLYGHKRSPFKMLKEATYVSQKTNKLVQNNITKTEKQIERERKKLKAQSFKKLKGTKNTALLKELKKLKQTLKDLNQSVKGKHMFEYIDYLKDRGQLAWVLTGKKSKFGKYEHLLRTIEKEGGTKKGKKSIDAAAIEAAAKGKKAESTKATKKENVHPDETETKFKVKPKLVEKKTAPEKEPTPQKASKKTTQKKKKKKRRKRRRSKSKFEPRLWGGNNYIGGSKLFFFTLGDLLSAILTKNNFGKKLEEQSPNFRLLLGEYDIPQGHGSSNNIRMSLYDLPISLEIFHTFVAQKIVGSGIPSYPLLQFIFDLVKFIMDKLQGTFGKAAEYAPESLTPVKFKLDLTSIDLPTDKIPRQPKPRKAVDAAKNKKKEQDSNVLVLGGSESINTLERTTVNNTSNSFVIHAQKSFKPDQGSSTYRGDINADAQRGIFHFFVGGPNKGLLKKINFSQSKNPLFEISLMRNGQSFGGDAAAGIIKPSKFNCEVTLVGNPYFFIGQMFYVNTELISAGHFNKEGILNGGYYVVTSVESKFTPDKWETKIRGVLNIPDSALRDRTARAAIAPLKNHPESEAITKQMNSAETSLQNVAKDKTPKNIGKMMA